MRIGSFFQSNTNKQQSSCIQNGDFLRKSFRKSLGYLNSVRDDQVYKTEATCPHQHKHTRRGSSSVSRNGMTSLRSESQRASTATLSTLGASSHTASSLTRYHESTMKKSSRPVVKKQTTRTIRDVTLSRPVRDTLPSKTSYHQERRNLFTTYSDFPVVKGKDLMEDDVSSVGTVEAEHEFGHQRHWKLNEGSKNLTAAGAAYEAAFYDFIKSQAKANKMKRRSQQQCKTEQTIAVVKHADGAMFF